MMLNPLPLLLILFALFHSSISINIYGSSPTCTPESSFTVVTINGAGLDGQNISINLAGNTLDSSLIINTNDAAVTFLAPKLNAGVYDLQLCSQASLFNCSQVCVNNCSTDADNTTSCTTNCTEQCTQINSTCYTTSSLTVYSLPPILLNINPSLITQKTNVSLYGKNFLNCGAATSVRLQSTDKVQVFPAWVNSATEIIFYADTTFSGIITLSLDGQHYDSIAASSIVLTMEDNSSGSQDSSSESPDPDHGGSHILLLSNSNTFLNYLLP